MRCVCFPHKKICSCLRSFFVIFYQLRTAFCLWECWFSNSYRKANTVISHWYVQFRAKKKFFTIENYLLVGNFLKHAGFHLFYPLQSFWAKFFFSYRELLVSEKFLYNTGFSLWFYSLRRVFGLFWAKSIISFFFKFIHWFNICLTRIVQ